MIDPPYFGEWRHHSFGERGSTLKWRRQGALGLATEISNRRVASRSGRYAGFVEFHDIDMDVLQALGKDDLTAIGCG